MKSSHDRAAGGASAAAPAEFPRTRGLPSLAETHPNSRKVAVGTLRVPMREVLLEGGKSSLRLYDTTGPQGIDPREGLPKLRAPWIEPRVRRGDANHSQMHYARGGIVTEEMRFVAEREGVPAEFVRSEIARG